MCAPGVSLGQTDWGRRGSWAALPCPGGPPGVAYLHGSPQNQAKATPRSPETAPHCSSIPCLLPHVGTGLLSGTVLATQMPALLPGKLAEDERPCAGVQRGTRGEGAHSQEQVPRGGGGGRVQPEEQVLSVGGLTVRGLPEQSPTGPRRLLPQRATRAPLETFAKALYEDSGNVRPVP